MKCIYCGRLCDYNETHTCRECAKKIARSNERVYYLSLLKEALPYITNRYLREKIKRAVAVNST